MAALLAILGAIGSVALFMGADWLVTKVEDIQANKKGLTQDQLLARLQGLVNTIAAKDSSLYNKITSRIAAMPDGDRVVNAGVRNQLRNRRKSLLEDANEVDKSIKDTETLQNRIVSFAAQPNSYKISKMGKQDLDSIEKSVEEAVSSH